MMRSLLLVATLICLSLPAFAQEPMDEAARQEKAASLLANFFLSVSEAQKKRDDFRMAYLQSVEVASDTVAEAVEDEDIEEGASNLMRNTLERAGEWLVQELAELGMSLKLDIEVSVAGLVYVSFELGVERSPDPD